MASDTVHVGHLICDSTTPPPDRGFYKINDTTTGHVGKLVMSDPVSGKESVVLTAASSDGGIDTRGQTVTLNYCVPYVLQFPDLTAPSILASFVAGTTASQSGTTVTVSATSHGIVGSTARDGHRIYFPGSPSIPAGWYGGFAWINANTVTFQRTMSATVASESVNGGVAFISTITAATLNLPGGTMGPRGRLTLVYERAGDSTAGTKTIRLALGGSVLGVHALATSPNCEARLTTRNIFAEDSNAGVLSIDGAATTAALNTAAVNTAVGQSVSVTMSVVNAAQWVCLCSAELEVVKA